MNSKALFINMLIVIHCLALPISSFAKSKKAEIKPYPHEWYFQQDTEPIKTEIIGNPFDYAGKRIGLDVRNFELPKAFENSYRFACRFPLIDYVSNQPLYMKQWADEVSAQFAQIQNQKGIEVTNYALTLLRDTELYPSMSISQNVELFEDFKDMLYSRSFTPAYRMAVLNLVENYLIAKLMVAQAKEDLTPEDLKFFNNNPGYFLIPDREHLPALTGDVSTHFEFISHARKFKYQYMFFAAKIMAEAIYKYWNAVKDLKVSEIYSDPSAYEEPFIYVTNSLRIVIRGIGNDEYKKDANLIIDVGGNDTYQNNAGGCRSSFDEIAVCIDHQGNDHYEAPKENYVQGSGFLGCGFLIDFEGNDVYEAQHFSQGTGVCGVGILWDVKGFDRYDAHGICQGAGMFGLGMLLDDAGEDIYNCATLGQGSATTLGMGILSDLEGDDRYYLAVDESKDNLGYLAGYGQGGALSFRNYPWKKKLTAYGGAGLLFDASGNDRYFAKGWCDQGGSYIMSLGGLVDAKGNDHYTASTGQGSGIHITNAILIDKEGHDIYEGGFRTGGSGGDRSPGLLLDYAGNDSYISRTSSYGTGVKPASYSLFIDYNGDDTYICENPKENITFNNWQSFGGVWPESEPYNWPYAICIDLEGEDDYQVKYHENNCERSSFGHGIFIDTEWHDGDVFGTIENKLKHQELPDLPKNIKDSQYFSEVEDLFSPSTFIRFQAVEKLIQDSTAILSYLADILDQSNNRNLNRDILEVIHYALTEQPLDSRIENTLFKCLSSPDEEVRDIITDDIGMWNITSGEDVLINLAGYDQSENVRYTAIKSLLQLRSVKALTLVRRACEKDPSEKVRRISIQYLGYVGDGIDPYPLLIYALQHDSSPSVQVEAAESLGRLKESRAVTLLREAAGTYDVYLQRAASKALAEMGYIEGIEMLIKSLSFPSIDAFENYNYNVPNVIAMYAGYDLPESERYDQQKWMDWFQSHKDSINIIKNLEIIEKYHSLQDSISELNDEDKLPYFIKFQQTYPDFMKVRKDLAALLNRIAWEKVTSPEGSQKYDPVKGLEFAKLCVQLDDQLNYIDTLAEAQLVNGNVLEAKRICEKVLSANSGDKMFLDRLSRCNTILNK